MELIVLLVVPFPLGLFVRSRTAAYLAFVGVFCAVFTFQTLELIVEWTGGDTSAFGPFPGGDPGQVWGYGEVNLVIAVVGLGLVALGAHLARRRRNRATVDLESGRV